MKVFPANGDFNHLLTSTCDTTAVRAFGPVDPMNATRMGKSRMVEAGVPGEDSTAHITLSVSLDASAVEDLLRSCREHTSGHSSLILDGSAVAYAGTPCLQVLAAAARDMRARGGTFQLRSPSSCLEDAIATLGLRAELVTEGSA